MGDAALCAIGLLEPDGVWVGLSRDEEGYRLVFGLPDASVVMADASRSNLLALAIAYFEDALGDPPPELEATQGDIAGLCRWLQANEPRDHVALLLGEAIDAIDDGLAADVTVARLADAFGAGNPGEQVDVVDLLANAYVSLRG